jgi:hypothetical protein
VGKTVRQEYRGWMITIRCMERLRPIDEVNFVSAYSSMAHAALLDSENPSDWIDPRVQIVTLGSREFENGDQCIETLLNDVMDVIDALKR